jgi:anti-anti-sigma factor
MQNDGLILRVEQHASGPVLHIKGEVDLATAPLLRERLLGLEGSVVVDLADVAFLDSTAISTLVVARKRLVRDGGSLTLRNPSDLVVRTLEVSGLHDWFEN